MALAPIYYLFQTSMNKKIPKADRIQAAYQLFETLKQQ